MGGGGGGGRTGEKFLIFLFLRNPLSFSNAQEFSNFLFQGKKNCPSITMMKIMLLFRFAHFKKTVQPLIKFIRINFATTVENPLRNCSCVFFCFCSTISILKTTEHWTRKTVSGGTIFQILFSADIHKSLGKIFADYKHPKRTSYLILRLSIAWEAKLTIAFYANVKNETKQNESKSTNHDICIENRVLRG